jgi:phosphopantothenate-cysteine ligase
MNVVVCGGGTEAPIDEVRSIVNTSTGRLAAAISEALLDQGATVWHVHPPRAVVPFEVASQFDLDTLSEEFEIDRLKTLRRKYLGRRERLVIETLPTGTVSEYANRLRHILETSPIDLVILPIAVSDYEPDPVAGKIESDADELVIRCHRAPKVIRSVRDWAPDVFLVGFKLAAGAATDDLIADARAAGRANRADLTVANDLREQKNGEHRLHLVPPDDGPVETLEPGDDLAERLVERILDRARQTMAARDPIPLDPSAEDN